MNDFFKDPAIILAILITVFVILVLGAYLLMNMIRKVKGTFSQYKASSVLLRYASIRRFRVMKDVDLSFHGKKAHADFVLIGFFGLVVVSCGKGYGEIFCNPSSEDWFYVRRTGAEKEYFKNPLKQAQDFTSLLREVFSSEKKFGVSIDSICIYAKMRKLTLYDAAGLPILTHNKFGSFMEKEKYEKDNGLDVAQLETLINQYTVKA